MHAKAIELGRGRAGALVTRGADPDARVAGAVHRVTLIGAPFVPPRMRVFGEATWWMLAWTAPCSRIVPAGER